MASLGSCFRTSLIILNKQQLASVSLQPLYLLLSGPRQGTNRSQPRFTAWLTLRITKPSMSSSHLRLLYSSSKVAPGKTQVELILAYFTQETLGTSHPVDSYRPHWSTTTLLLYSWSSTEGRYWWSMVTANPCSWLAWVTPSHWSANSNQGSTIRGGCAQPTWRTHLKYPAWVIEEVVPLDSTGHLLY